MHSAHSSTSCTAPTTRRTATSATTSTTPSQQLVLTTAGGSGAAHRRAETTQSKNNTVRQCYTEMLDCLGLQELIFMEVFSFIILMKRGAKVCLILDKFTNSWPKHFWESYCGHCGDYFCTSNLVKIEIFIPLKVKNWTKLKTHSTSFGQNRSFD